MTPDQTLAYLTDMSAWMQRFYTDRGDLTMLAPPPRIEDYS